MLWLIATLLNSETDTHAVPCVDGGNRQGEVRQFLIREVRSDALVDLVRETIPEQGQSGHLVEKSLF